MFCYLVQRFALQILSWPAARVVLQAAGFQGTGTPIGHGFKWSIEGSFVDGVWGERSLLNAADPVLRRSCGDPRAAAGAQR